MIRAIHIVRQFILLLVSACLTVAAAHAESGKPSSPLADTAENRIIAFGDVHGGVTELRALLQALRLIDSSDNWTGGQTRLVSLGDLLDRGPDSRAVMDLLMQLETQAADTGGAVHLVLGNHELMNLTGDLRYVSDAEYAAFKDDEDPAQRADAFVQFQIERAAAAEKQLEARVQPSSLEAEAEAEAAFTEKFPPGYFAHRAAFAPEGRYGSWLLSKPQILELDRIAFVHGGLSEAFVSEPIDAFNSRAEDELRQLLAAAPPLIASGRLSAWQDLVTGSPTDGQTLPSDFKALQSAWQFDPSGPAWYRGTAACHALIERPRFEAVLAARDLDRIVMGHTPTNPRIIQTRFEDRAVLADTGMYAGYYQGYPSAVVFDDEEMLTLTLRESGELAEFRGKPAVDLRSSSQELWLENVESALKELSLTPNKSVTFEANGRRLEAIWHKGNRREQSARLAAFDLDKLLGFGLVAPVLRLEQNGRAGVVEVIPAATLSETSRATGNVYRPSYCRSGGDFDLLLVLDALMGQEDRNGDNVAYDRVNWLIYLTEQHRAFSRQTRLPRYLAEQSITLPPLVAEKLRSLDFAMLDAALGEHLEDRQIQAILTRRDLVLERWSEAE